LVSERAPVRALIFDMDGVIIHSNPVHREAWVLYNRRFGIETDDAMLQRMLGRRNDEIIQDFFGGNVAVEEVAAHGAAKEALYREIIGSRVSEALVPGVREFLPRHQGMPIGLATNAEPANVEFLFERAGLRPFFHVVVDGHQVANPKPHPEVYLKAAELLGVAATNCVVFEDSHSGIQAARAAGMRVVGVRTTHAELPGVDLEIDDFRSPALEPWLAGR
jgi:beta-phosphoglucomutase family hydrolase